MLTPHHGPHLEQEASPPSSLRGTAIALGAVAVVADSRMDVPFLSGPEAHVLQKDRELLPGPASSVHLLWCYKAEKVSVHCVGTGWNFRPVRSNNGSYSDVMSVLLCFSLQHIGFDLTWLRLS